MGVCGGPGEEVLVVTAEETVLDTTEVGVVGMVHAVAETGVDGTVNAVIAAEESDGGERIIMREVDFGLGANLILDAHRTGDGNGIGTDECEANSALGCVRTTGGLTCFFSEKSIVIGGFWAARVSLLFDRGGISLGSGGKIGCGIVGGLMLFFLVTSERGGDMAGSTTASGGRTERGGIGIASCTVATVVDLRSEGDSLGIN